jgi:hypothetical protein
VETQAADRLEEDHQQEDLQEEDLSAHLPEAAMAAALEVEVEESWGEIHPQNSMVIALKR